MKSNFLIVFFVKKILILLLVLVTVVLTISKSLSPEKGFLETVRPKIVCSTISMSDLSERYPFTEW